MLAPRRTAAGILLLVSFVMGGVILSLSPKTAIGSDQPTPTPCTGSVNLAPTFVPQNVTQSSGATAAPIVVNVPCATATRTLIASPGTRIPLAQSATLTPSPTRTTQANVSSGNSPLVASSGTGLYGRYFSDISLTNFVTARVDATINFIDWNVTPPPLTLPIPAHNFSVRWTGQIQPLYGESYTFSGYSDDGIRVWIDGKLVFDHWSNFFGSWNTAPIPLEAGQRYDIRIEYWEDFCCGAVTTLYWSSASQASQIVPQSQLYPTSQIDTIGAFQAPGTFFLRYSNTTGTANRTVTLTFAAAGDIPVTGDWDGDGVEGIGVFRPSNGQWFLVNNTASASSISTWDKTLVFGILGDLPLVGHWKHGPDSAGAYHDGIGIYRSSTAQFFLRNDLSNGTADYQMTFGVVNTDKGIVGDWNGDGVDSPSIFRPSSGMIYVSNAREVSGTITQNANFTFGSPGDIPFTGDWVGLDTSGVGMYGSATVKQNYNLQSNVTNATFAYGASGFTPLAGKWDRFCGAADQRVRSPKTLCIVGGPTPTPSATAVVTLTPIPPQSCTLTITVNPNNPPANVRRGPSADDLFVTSPAQGTPFAAVAIAHDEQSQIWYGFYHPNLRTQYLSWVVKTSGVYNISQVTGSGCTTLPPMETQPDAASWSTPTIGNPQLPLQPNSLDTSKPFRGFGMTADDYGFVYKCQHPGFDFPAHSPGIPVYAIVDGIVVGMGANGQGDRPAKWGATLGGYNLVIRTSGQFVLYGHLGAIEDSLYYGKRVKAGDIVGSLADQEANTHLHIQINAFVVQGDSSASLRPRFGAVMRAVTGASNPLYVTDIMASIPSTNRGNNPATAQSATGGTAPCVITTPYPYTIYSNVTLSNVYGDSIFNYYSKNNVATKCFNSSVTGTGGIYATCTSFKPTPSPTP
ncbi:MAG: PA14 domain-containing protein [Chloroflexota bacterium]